MEKQEGNKKESSRIETTTHGLGKFEPGLKNIVLYAFGSFNPFHNGHLGMIMEAKKHFDSLGKYNILGGYFCPTGDEKLASKFKKKLGKKEDVSSHSILAKHRIAMMNLVFESDPSYKWIMVDEWSAYTNATARDTRKNLQITIKKFYGEENANKIKLLGVIGSDAVLNMASPSSFQEGIVLVNRKTDFDIFSWVREHPNKESIIFIVAEGWEDVSYSSTLVRTKMEKKESLEGIVHPVVEKYLKVHSKEIWNKQPKK